MMPLLALLGCVVDLTVVQLRPPQTQELLNPPRGPDTNGNTYSHGTVDYKLKCTLTESFAHRTTVTSSLPHVPSPPYLCGV
eukprot:3611660-Amphidinium_carterae.1